MKDLKRVTDYKFEIKPRAGLPLPDNLMVSLINGYYSTGKYDRELGRSLTPDDAVKRVMTLQQTAEFINGLDKSQKMKYPVLKGVYKGGIKGEFCVETSDLLPLDIDKTGNEELWKSGQRDLYFVYQWLEERVPLLFFSQSGGIGGFIYVPNLSQFGHDEKSAHKKAAEYIYEYLQHQIREDLGVKVKFDKAQGAFRQIRNLAAQPDVAGVQDVRVNKSPTSYHLSVERTEKSFSSGTPVFTKRGGVKQEGSIRAKFNAKFSIEEALAMNNFKKTGVNQWGWEYATSDRSAALLDDGTLMILSQSFDANAPRPYDAFQLYQRAKGWSTYDMYTYCREKLKIEPDELDPQDFIRQVKPDLSMEEIYELCTSFAHQNLRFREQLLREAPIPPDKKQAYADYLGIKNLKLSYDEEIPIKRYVSEALPQVFDIADEKKKVALIAETGSGKTTSILKDFEHLRPNKKLLINEPLTAIVRQADSTEDEPRNIMRIQGVGADLPPDTWWKLRTCNMVVATHHHSTELLKKTSFDYVVRDEIHSDILGNAFRASAIRKLNEVLRFDKSVQIALTGTPSGTLSRLGYYMVRLVTPTPPTTIIQRHDNRDSLNVAMQHHQSVGMKEKVIYRINSKKVLSRFRTHLIKKYGYKPDEVIIFESSDEVKFGEEYKGLVSKSKLSKKARVVLTTSILDEGVSIKNTDFSQVIFIGNQHAPRPEPLKQFLARFRDKTGITYFHYRRFKKNQFPEDFSSTWEDHEDYIDMTNAELEEWQPSTWGSLATDDRFRYEDGSPNPYMIAYEDTSAFFNSLNIVEFNKFLELNYNIKVEVDRQYTEDDIKVKRISQVEIREKLTQLWENNHGELAQAIHDLSSDRDVKSACRLDGSTPSEETKALVKENLPYLEKLIKMNTKFYFIMDGENTLIYNSSDILDSTEALSRKNRFLNVQKTLQQPQNATDQLARRRLKGFIGDCEQAFSFTIDQAREMWERRQLPNADKVPDHFFKDFIAANTDKYYKGRSFKCFIEKGSEGKVNEREVPTWVRKFDEEYDFKVNIKNPDTGIFEEPSKQMDLFYD